MKEHNDKRGEVLARPEDDEFELGRPLMMFLRSVPGGYQCHFDEHTFIPLKRYCEAAATRIERLEQELAARSSTRTLADEDVQPTIEGMKEAFILLGYWPNEILWKVWKEACLWRAQYARSATRENDLTDVLKLVRKVLAKDKPMIGSRDETLLCRIDAVLHRADDGAKSAS